MAGSIKPAPQLHRSRGVVRLKATITCDALGDATGVDYPEAFGRIVGVAYRPGTLATGVDITVTDKASGKAILVITNAGASALYFQPTAVATDNTGTALTANSGAGGAGNGPDVNRDIVVGGKLTVSAAQGGAAGVGGFDLIVCESAGLLVR